MFIIPYLVLAAVALLFSFICYMMFFGVPGRKKTADHREIEKKASEVPSREDIVKKVLSPRANRIRKRSSIRMRRRRFFHQGLERRRKPKPMRRRRKFSPRKNWKKRQKGILCRMPRDRSRQNPILSSSMRNRMWISLKNTLSNIS